MISQGCTLCIKTGLCFGPARGWGGPHSIGPKRAVLTWQRAGVGFRLVVPEPQVRRGSKNFRPSCKKHCWGTRWGADRFIYARRFCLSSTRHRKVVQNPKTTERGEVVIKPNTAGGSVGRARCTIEKWSRIPTLYTTLGGSTAQSSWCIRSPCCYRSQDRSVFFSKKKFEHNIQNNQRVCVEYTMDLL